MQVLMESCAIAVARPRKRPLGGDTTGDVSIERQGRRKGRQRREHLHGQGVAAVGRFPWERDATRFKRTAHVFTRLFQEAMEANKLHVARAARAMAGWRLRQWCKGRDYSHGALASILSLAGDDFSAMVTRQSEPLPKPEDQKLLSAELLEASTSWAEVDDGRSCISCMVYAEGEWRILCNRRFSNTFSTRDEITRRVEELSVVPSFYYSSTVCAEDHDEFVRLLANVYFDPHAGEASRGEKAVVLKCVDKHGASFLAHVHLQMVAVAGAYIGLRLSILPLPRSDYMSGSVDMAANSFGSVDSARDMVC